MPGEGPSASSASNTSSVSGASRVSGEEGRGAGDRAILLAGMMGSGKTSVGRALAGRLGWDFIDTDARIEAEAEQSIAEIFRRGGESRFRALERAVLERLPERRAVIALGGGALVAEENRALLRGKGTLVWLDAPAESLLERVGDARERPLLAGLDRGARLERLRALAAARRDAYAEADLRVATGSRTPDEVCEAVLASLSDREGAA